MVAPYSADVSAVRFHGRTGRFAQQYVLEAISLWGSAGEIVMAKAVSLSSRIVWPSKQTAPRRFASLSIWTADCRAARLQSESLIPGSKLWTLDPTYATSSGGRTTTTLRHGAYPGIMFASKRSGVHRAGCALSVCGVEGRVRSLAADCYPVPPTRGNRH
jgi:hypothetical protein